MDLLDRSQKTLEQLVQRLLQQRHSQPVTSVQTNTAAWPAGPQNPIIKQLNLTKEYESARQPATNEQVQNWIDQISTQKPGSAQLTTERHQLEDWDVYLIGQPTSNSVYGYAAESQRARVLVLRNYGTAMDLDSMSLGCSNNRTQEAAVGMRVTWQHAYSNVAGWPACTLFAACAQHAERTAKLMGQRVGPAGMFGEGMKVEMNRLLASGCKVRYWTANMIWKFGYAADHPGALQQTLHLTAEYLPQRSPDTTIVIADPSHALPGEHLLQRDRFLLFDPPEPEQACGGSMPAGQESCSLQLLLDKQYRGRVYVHGTFIMEERLLNIPGHMQFGMNFTGSKQEQKALGLGRDRNHVSARNILHYLPQLYLQLKSQPIGSLQHKQAGQMIGAVVDSLQLLDNSHAATKWLLDWGACTAQHWKAMMQDIHSVLCQRAATQLGQENFYLAVPDGRQDEVRLSVVRYRAV